MKKAIEKIKRRNRRKMHVRKRIRGTAQRPRLTIYKSNRHVYIQAIDDDKGTTLASASNLEKELAGVKSVKSQAGRIGAALAQRLMKQDVTAAVFDRNGYPFHGIVKAVADAAREAGIKF
jgi:large subunit ribosomal protein L18